MSNKVDAVVGEASESEDENENIKNLYGIAVDGEASESEDDDQVLKYGRPCSAVSAHDDIRMKRTATKFFKGVQADKIWFILNEFRFLIWEEMKQMLENDLGAAAKTLKNADKMLLKSQVELGAVTSNLIKSRTNIQQSIDVVERLKGSKFIPNINI